MTGGSEVNSHFSKSLQNQKRIIFRPTWTKQKRDNTHIFMVYITYVNGNLEGGALFYQHWLWPINLLGMILEQLI